MEWSEKLLKAPSKALEAAELVPATTWALVGASTSAQNGFEQLPLSPETYAALGAIDEEIYILRLRYIPGSAKGFALI
jgi:hypothetical protein